MVDSSPPTHVSAGRESNGEHGRQGFGGIVVLCLAVAIVSGVIGGGIAAWTIGRQVQPGPVIAEQTPLISYVEAAEASAAAVYEATAASIVTINVAATDGERRGRGVGTGIIVDESGHILTNNHVISDVDRVLVTLLDGSSAFAEIIGRDASTDLAVIRANFPPGTLRVARFGDSQAVSPGDPVFAIGAPFGFAHSISSGIVSAVGRTYRTQGRSISGAIQSDAVINPGNSGGPLLNANGEVIGITTAIQSNSEVFMGVGLSIPSNLVQSLLPKLIRGEDIRRTYMGINMRSVTPLEARNNNLGVRQGVQILNVVEGSPAAQAGLRGSRDLTRADIITAIDGEPMRVSGDLIAYIQTKSVGDTITVTVVRRGETLDLPLTLGPWPDS